MGAINVVIVLYFSIHVHAQARAFKVRNLLPVKYSQYLLLEHHADFESYTLRLWNLNLWEGR